MEFFKDKFETRPETPDELLDVASHFHANERWLSADSKLLTVVAGQSGYAGNAADIEDDDTVFCGEVRGDVFKDTLANTNLFLKNEYGNILPVRSCAVPSLFQKAGFSCDVARILYEGDYTQKERLAQLLSEFFPIMGKTLRLHESFDKVSFVGSEKYSALPPVRLLNGLFDALEDRFGEYDYLRGYISHESTSCTVALPDHTKGLCNSYEKMIASKGCAGRILIPEVSFVTSEIGDCCATVMARLRDKDTDTSLLLGSVVSIIHKGDDDHQYEAFMNETSNIYARYQKVTENLARLADIDIDYPQETMARVAKDVGLRTKALEVYFQRAMDTYDAMWGNDPANAHECYWALSEIFTEMRRDECPEPEIMAAEEKLFKALNPHFEWSRRDYLVKGTKTA